MPARPSLRSLTSLRFFAAMLVVFYHCGMQFRFPAWTGDFFTNGYEAVSFFFVLSGFILTYVYASDPVREVPRQRFWVARIARICPVYYLALLLDLPRLLYSVFRVGNTAKPRFALAAVSTPFFLQSWIPSAEDVWNVPAWSLSVEAFFYLLFPFIAMPLRRTRAVPLLVAALALVVMAGSAREIVATHNFSFPIPSIVHFSPLFHLPQFILGIAFARLFLVPARFSPSGAELLFMLTALLVCGVLWFRSHLPSIAVSDALLGPLYGLLIYTAALAIGPLSGALSRPLLVWMGEISYGIYILHVPLYFFWTRTCERLLHISPVVALWTFIPLLLLGCSVVFQFIERPFRKKLASRLTFNRHTIV
jgi:peptidoglycan/LPS O-acetylase OafA/YrhL